MENKNTRYKALVAKRKEHTFPIGLLNPNKIKEVKYDCDEIGAWSQWQGNLDADILVIGKDWGDLNSFITDIGKGKGDDKNNTNVNLIKLFKEIGYDIGFPSKPNKDNKIFFTNAVLGIKGEAGKKDMKASLKKCWIEDSNFFTKELIYIIKPKLIFTLGKDALYAMRLLYNDDKIPNKKMSEIVGDKPIKLKNGIYLFAFFHCGGLGIRNRSFKEQLKDWEKVKQYLTSK